MAEASGWDSVSIQRLQWFDRNETRKQEGLCNTNDSLIDYEIKERKRLTCGTKKLGKTNGLINRNWEVGTSNISAFSLFN